MRDPRSRRADRSILLLVLIVLVAGAAALFFVLQLRVDPVTEALKSREPVSTLFVVSDGPRAQFLEVFFYNPTTRKGSLYYVPANVGGVIPSINKQAALGVLYRRGAPAALQARVEELLGVPLQSVIDVSTADLVRLVDLLGGVELFIPTPVDIAQPGGTRVLLPSGSVVLDGDKALQYVSYRDPLEGDTEQAARRQRFLQALLRGLGENSAFLRARGPSRMLRSLVRTTLPGRALASLVEEMGSFDAERMVLQRVLGTTRSVDGEDLLFPHQDGELLRQSVRQVIAANASREVVPAETLALTVEVLNGTRTAGLATRARDLLLSYDLEVMAPNNADNDQYANTVVFDRKGSIDNARRVAAIINCTRVYSKPDPQLDQAVDVTVILGRDFDGRTVK